VIDTRAQRGAQRAASTRTLARGSSSALTANTVYFHAAGLSAVAVLDPDGDRIVAKIPVGASPHYANFTRGDGKFSAGSAW